MPTIRPTRSAPRLLRACVVLAAAAWLATSAVALAAPQGRIISGRPVSSTEYATGAVVGIADRTVPNAWDAVNCGGVLVAPKVVVTARHCVETAPFAFDAGTVDVVRGAGTGFSLPRTGWTGVTRVRVVSIHRSAGSFEAAYRRGADIAVLRLASPVPGATPIAYARPEQEVLWGGDFGRELGVTALGWGATIDTNLTRGIEAGGYADALRSVELPVVAPADCLATAQEPAVTRNYLCAGTGRETSPVRAACYGDSGGPLVATDPADGAADATPTTARTLIGITSYNETEACGDSYGRFVRIANFAGWLDGFLAVPAGAPSGLIAPRVTRVTLVGTRAAIKVAPTRGSVRTRVFAKQGGTASLELGTVPAAGGSIDLPASRTGLIKVHVRAVDARGDESASSVARAVKTRVDRRGPVVAKFAVRALASGAWALAWSRPTDTDRAVEYTIEKRRKGTSAWTPGTYGECLACWTSPRGRFATSDSVSGLVGAWQFRLTVFDRAGNATVKVAG